jgi:hypothetical protein
MKTDEKHVKQLLTDMLDKFGLDEDKWREHMNSLPKEERSMEFVFDTDAVKNGFVLKFNYIVSAVDITITDQKLLEEIEKDNME